MFIHTNIYTVLYIELYNRTITHLFYKRSLKTHSFFIKEEGGSADGLVRSTKYHASLIPVGDLEIYWYWPIEVKFR